MAFNSRYVNRFSLTKLTNNLMRLAYGDVNSTDDKNLTEALVMSNEDAVALRDALLKLYPLTSTGFNS